jgi:hypothetical protein
MRLSTEWESNADSSLSLASRHRRTVLPTSDCGQLAMREALNSALQGQQIEVAQAGFTDQSDEVKATRSTP